MINKKHALDLEASQAEDLIITQILHPDGSTKFIVKSRHWALIQLLPIQWSCKVLLNTVAKKVYSGKEYSYKIFHWSCYGAGISSQPCSKRKLQ